MQVKFTKDFDKELDRLNNKKQLFEIREIVEQILNAGSISEIRNLKKLKGHKTAYRIRTGDYRIGIFIEKNIVEFAIFEHRKDIYKKFP